MSGTKRYSVMLHHCFLRFSGGHFFGNQRYLIVLVTGVCLRLFLAWFTPEYNDTYIAHVLASFILTGKNPYAEYLMHGGAYPSNPPMLMYWTAIAAWLADFLHTPYGFMWRLPGLVGDVAIAFFLLRFAKLKKQRFSFFTAIMLSPVLILISGLHGQVDSFILLFVLLSWYFLPLQVVFSGLMMGFAVSWKQYALLFVPLFILSYRMGLKNKLTYVALSLLPAVILLIPFVGMQWQNLLPMLQHSGPGDYGLVAAYRAGYWLLVHKMYIEVPGHRLLIEITKWIFVGAYLFFLWFYRHSFSKQNLPLATAISLGLFYILAGGIGSQYLVLIIPFLLLVRIRLAWIYSIAAMIAMVPYYVLFQPREVLWLMPWFTVSGATEASIRHGVLQMQTSLVHVPLGGYIFALLIIHFFTTVLFWLVLVWIEIQLFHGLHKARKS